MGVRLVNYSVERYYRRVDVLPWPSRLTMSQNKAGAVLPGRGQLCATKLVLGSPDGEEMESRSQSGNHKSCKISTPSVTNLESRQPEISNQDIR